MISQATGYSATEYHEAVRELLRNITETKAGCLISPSRAQVNTAGQELGEALRRLGWWTKVPEPLEPTQIMKGKIALNPAGYAEHVVSHKMTEDKQFRGYQEATRRKDEELRQQKVAELTNAALERQDLVDNAIHSFLATLAPVHVKGPEGNLPWDAELIGVARDILTDLVGRFGWFKNEYEFYPYFLTE